MIRIAAGLQDSRYVLSYQDTQDVKNAQFAENLKLVDDGKIRLALKNMGEIHDEIATAESIALGFIDEENWEAALELVTDPEFSRNKALYRSQLSTAMREIIRSSQEQVEQSNQLALTLQIGVLLTFLALSALGFLSLKRHSELTSNLADANDNLEHRVRERTDELKAKQAQLQIALDNMPGGMFMIDKNLKFQIFNDQYADLFSLPANTVRIGGSLTEVVRFRAERGDYGPGDAKELVAQRLDGYIDRGSFRSEERLPGGQVIEFQRRQTDQGGIVAVSADITERKSAEEALHDNEKRFKAVLDNMADGVYLLDAQQNFALINEQYLSLVNLPDSDIAVGGPVEAAIRGHAERGDYGPGDVDEIISVRLQALANADAVQVELSIDDGRRALDLRKAATGDGGAVVVVTDITNAKKSEEALRRSEARFQTVLDNMPVAVYLRDTSGRYTLVNQAYKEIFGITDVEIYGKDLNDLLSPTQSQEYLNQDREVIEKGVILEFETKVESDEGPKLLSTVKFPVRDHRGIIEGVGGVDVDITERQKAQQLIEDAHTVTRDSIQYASRIQRSLLPNDDLLTETFTDHFCIWEPRDVVGGDMYWVEHDRKGYFVVLFDCTGHGVPGALMTTIAVSALKVAFAETADPSRLIARVNQIVKQALGQEEKKGLSDDGLEMGVCHVEPERMRLTYAGARFELLSAIGSEIEIIKGDKSGLGYRHVPYDQRFSNRSLRLRRGQRFYMCTDGIIDQVGGNKKRAFGRKRLISILKDTSHMSLDHQKDAITRVFGDYQGAGVRRDDVSIIGFMPLG